MRGRPRSHMTIVRGQPSARRKRLRSNPPCQQRVSGVRRNVTNRGKPLGRGTRSLLRSSTPVHSGRSPSLTRQAGGHWFEPSTAHWRTRWKRRVLSFECCCREWERMGVGRLGDDTPGPQDLDVPASASCGLLRRAPRAARCRSAPAPPESRAVCAPPVPWACLVPVCFMGSAPAHSSSLLRCESQSRRCLMP
jgi:hypothetical protein